jgi:hypothetical protein
MIVLLWWVSFVILDVVDHEVGYYYYYYDGDDGFDYQTDMFQMIAFEG